MLQMIMDFFLSTLGNNYYGKTLNFTVYLSYTEYWDMHTTVLQVFHHSVTPSFRDSICNTFGFCSVSHNK